jgi:hypothetical protein
MTTGSHHDNVEKQFGAQASAYLTSAVHASAAICNGWRNGLAHFQKLMCWI